MGTDNLFHKRKKRKVESLRRRRATIAPYDVVLIVCEGEKTEPNYFAALKRVFRLSNTNIKVCGCGSDPITLVNFAIATFKREREFDRVYCVFDRDRHTTYTGAIKKISQTRLGGGSKISAVPSVPCFEFWILLHFKYTTRPFDAPAGASICSRVIQELAQYLPSYQKKDRDIFYMIQDKLDEAITNARQIEQFHLTSGTDNPSTAMHRLVGYLRDLRKR